MSDTNLNDYQLFEQAKAAIRAKNAERAQNLLTEISERSVARDKARVANDLA
jgi:hypothetical protein